MTTTDTKQTRKATVTKKPTSLKIDRKKKRSTTATVTAKKRKPKLVIKQAKADRILRKIRTITRRALRKALKGLNIGHVPDKTYKKIDSSIARNTELAAIVEQAVVAVVNDMSVVKKTSQSGKEPAEKKSRKKKTTVNTKKVKRVPKAAAKDATATA